MVWLGENSDLSPSFGNLFVTVKGNVATVSYTPGRTRSITFLPGTLYDVLIDNHY